METLSNLERFKYLYTDDHLGQLICLNTRIIKTYTGKSRRIYIVLR